METPILTKLKFLAKHLWLRRDKMWKSSRAMRNETKPPVVFTCNLLQWVGPHVQHHDAIHDAAPQLKQAVQRQGGHVGLTPPFAAVFNILFKFQPPGNKFKELNNAWEKNSLSTNFQADRKRIREVHLAVSFHSASSPSLRQISSISVNRACGMCSSSPSSVPRRNCTLWAGVSMQQKLMGGKNVKEKLNKSISLEDGHFGTTFKSYSLKKHSILIESCYKDRISYLNIKIIKISI